MTIRSRLILGFLAIAVVLLIPFLMALNSLRSLHDTTRLLQQNEFTGSILIGRITEAVEDLRRTEIIVSFGDNPAYYVDSMRITYGRLLRLTDSLGARAAGGASTLDSAVRALGHFMVEHEQVAVARTSETRALAEAAADSIFENHLSPAISAIHDALPALERQFDERTAAYFVDADALATSAQRAGMIGLGAAAILAAAIALWLTLSISAPVRELEKAMSTVADGDFSYSLPLGSGAPAEFSRLGRSYKSMVRQLSELDKLKAEFVSVASHELKTPINVISGYLQLLDEGVYGELNDKQREINHVLESQSQGLSRLVHQLLDVSRFEAGGGRIETRELELRRFLDELEGAFSVLAIQRNVQFRVVRDSNIPRQVQWDGDRIREVIGNILSNAFKFTPDGGTVELSVRSSNERINLSVRDTGAGIPSRQLPHIFEKFFQADNQADTTQRGTGLGLAIAREIVEAHAGSISVESTVGEGTTFQIVLPAVVQSGRDVGRRFRTPHHPAKVE